MGMNTMRKRKIPEWARSENIRWAFWGWDPLPYYRRLGGKKEAFFGNNEWMSQWWERIYSHDTVKKMSDIGINMAITQFYKGAGLDAEKDLREKLKPLVKICHKYNIKVMGYVQAGTVFPESMKLEEPDCEHWTVRNYDGSIRSWNYYRWWQCFSQPALMEYIQKVVKIGYDEIGLDGFHFDNAVMLPCYCNRCREGFREYLSKKIKSPERMWITDFSCVEPPPPSPAKHVRDPLMQEWIRYTCEKGAENFGKLYDYVKVLNPELLIHANTGFPRSEKWASELGINPYLFGQHTDLLCAENVNFPCFKNGELITQIDAFRYGETIGFQILPSSWIHNSENTEITFPTTASQAKLSIAEPQILGGCPGVNYALRTTGGSSLLIDNEEISVALKKYISFFDAHKKFYSSARTLAKVGLFHSFDSFAMGGHEVYMASSGMVLSLIDANIPYKYIMEEDMSNLDDFTVIVLSNQMCLNKETCEKIIDFVKCGGKLYLSGHSGEYDENFLLRSKNAFTSIIGDTNVVYRPDIPESCPNADISDIEHLDWLGPKITLPKKYNEVVVAIRTLLKEDNFITVKAPPSVVVTPRILPDSVLALHVLNYDYKSKVKKVEINLNLNYLSGKEYTVYNPDIDRTQTISFDRQNTLKIILRDLETYQLVVIPLSEH